MNIIMKKNGDVLEIALEGRLDTATAPKLEEAVKTYKEDFKNIVFDFSDLEYVSSAGLRVLLLAKKMTGSAGSVTVKNANDIVQEVFEVTGFDEIITIE